MGDKSTIEWTDATWNPVVGCSKVSPGCAHCYAETVHRTRLSGRAPYSDFRPWTPENAAHNVALAPERLDQPLRWRKPRMIFVNSMSDLFHELIPNGYIGQVMSVIRRSPQHVFQVLTKRPERARDLLSTWWSTNPADWTECGHDPPPPNLWLGTSIENRRYVDRADALRATPCAVRFISAEPLLAPLVRPGDGVGCSCGWPLDPCNPAVARGACDRRAQESPQLDLTGIDWLIVGGESGLGHRPIRSQWVRDLRDVASDAGTAFFFKQWGGRTPKAGGRELDGQTYDEMPECPAPR